MSVEQQLTKAVQACNNLTAAVDGKIDDIDRRVIKARDEFDQWRETVKAKDIEGAPLYKTVIDLTWLPTDFFYPVWWEMPANHHGGGQIIISRTYHDDNGLDPFGDGRPHISGLYLHIEGVAHQWSGDANFMAIKRLSQTYRKTVRNIYFGLKCIARPVNGDKPMYRGYTDGQIVSNNIRSGLYLRGGLSYQVAKNFADNFWYSRSDQEVSTGSSVQTEFEIKWNAKSYHIDDEFLENDYDDQKLAYAMDFDNRYSRK